MPELPEVETSCRGIAPYLQQQTVSQLVVRERRLRWPVAAEMEAIVAGQRIEQVSRRAKYILIALQRGHLMLHLGMSGSVRIIEPTDAQSFKKHDHFDLVLSNGVILRYNDPRRFGSLHFAEQATEHRLIKGLGVEPLDGAFNAAYLHSKAKGRKVAIKIFIMNQQVVVGVGNIYASEALFMAGISPQRVAHSLGKAEFAKLVECVKIVLQQAIDAGGTTLQNFTQSDGKPGYFKQVLSVYGRAGELCLVCKKNEIKKIVQGQRATFFCSQCQK